MWYDFESGADRPQYGERGYERRKYRQRQQLGIGQETRGQQAFLLRESNRPWTGDFVVSAWFLTSPSTVRQAVLLGRAWVAITVTIPRK